MRARVGDKLHPPASQHPLLPCLVALCDARTPPLQVNHGGDWVTVDPVHGTYTVNVGDMLEVWTNGRYPASEHRVLARADSERFSAPFFYNPSYDAHVAPLRYVGCATLPVFARSLWHGVHITDSELATRLNATVVAVCAVVSCWVLATVTCTAT